MLQILRIGIRAFDEFLPLRRLAVNIRRLCIMFPGVDSVSHADRSMSRGKSRPLLRIIEEFKKNGSARLHFLRNGVL